jgi:hypothetical protein
MKAQSWTSNVAAFCLANPSISSPSITADTFQYIKSWSIHETGEEAHCWWGEAARCWWSEAAHCSRYPCQEAGWMRKDIEQKSCDGHKGRLNVSTRLNHGLGIFCNIDDGQKGKLWHMTSGERLN